MNEKILRYFLEEKKNIFTLKNIFLEDGNTALHVAAIYEPEESHNPCLELLIEKGFNLNVAES
jgi:ankyrin repeat protein